MRAEILHPARTIHFDTLRAGLQHSMAAGLVPEAVSGDLRHYCYTERYTYERQWNLFTEIACGLILNVAQRKIAAALLQSSGTGVSSPGRCRPGRSNASRRSTAA